MTMHVGIYPVLYRALNHTQLALVLCFRNFRLQSCAIKQTTVYSMRSERGLYTTLHCLQWYKLVLRTRLSAAVQYPLRSGRIMPLCTMVQAYTRHAD